MVHTMNFTPPKVEGSQHQVAGEGTAHQRQNRGALNV
jgi:hypothetical protein